MKRFLWFGFGVICLAVLAAAGTPGPKHPVEFTLTLCGSEPDPMSFTLAPRLGVAMALAGPGGLGLIEDADPPHRTAIGFCALYSNTIGEGDTASGFRALYSNTTGDYNTASGYEALTSNTTGSINTASGASSLVLNTTGNGNTAGGGWALLQNTSGDFNTASGCEALTSNTTGSNNTAGGASGLLMNTTGWSNTAIGFQALGTNTTGSYNTAIGQNAGNLCLDGRYNIYLGAEVYGSAAETNSIRIGNPYDSSAASGQNQTFIAGIVENPIAASLAPAVVGITSDGRLGTVPPDSLPPGPQGPPGDGFISGSLLFLLPSATPPASGYTFLGTCDLSLTVPGTKRPTKLTVNVYQKV